jgi:guanine nucleotide-binding protein subunit alpha
MGCCYSRAKGCCHSKRIVGDEKQFLKIRDQEIEEQIKKDRQKMNREVKLLLLGKNYSLFFLAQS